MKKRRNKNGNFLLWKFLFLVRKLSNKIYRTLSWKIPGNFTSKKNKQKREKQILLKPYLRNTHKYNKYVKFPGIFHDDIDDK